MEQGRRENTGVGGGKEKKHQYCGQELKETTASALSTYPQLWSTRIWFLAAHFISFYVSSVYSMLVRFTPKRNGGAYWTTSTHRSRVCSVMKVWELLIVEKLLFCLSRKRNTLEWIQCSVCFWRLCDLTSNDGYRWQWTKMFQWIR